MSSAEPIENWRGRQRLSLVGLERVQLQWGAPVVEDEDRVELRGPLGDLGDNKVFEYGIAADQGSELQPVNGSLKFPTPGRFRT